MSSKKNRNKNLPKQQLSRDLTTEKLTRQLNSDEEETGQDSGSSAADSSRILAEYERSEREAEERKAERLRLAELEKQEKEQQRQAARAAVIARMESFDREEPPQEEDPAVSGTESDVKEFIPREKKPFTEEPEEESLSEGLTRALSENYEELRQDSRESEPGTDAAADISEAADIAPEEPGPVRPNKFYLVFAVFVIIMSVIGVISTVDFISDKVSDIANRTELKNEIALFLYPIVSVDPPDCDTVDELPSTIVVEAAIWRIILTGDNSNYERLYNNYMYVPAVDVEYSVRSIFGNSVKIEHQTVGTMDIMFTYNQEMNSYLVPVNPHYTAYSPRVTEVTNIGELYTATVEYIPPSALAVEGIEFENQATKTMVYTLSKSKNSATLHSIKNITRLDSTNAY